MFKVNNKDTRTTLNVNFEYINAYWVTIAFTGLADRISICFCNA